MVKNIIVIIFLIGNKTFIEWNEHSVHDDKHSEQTEKQKNIIMSDVMWSAGLFIPTNLSSADTVLCANSEFRAKGWSGTYPRKKCGLGSIM